MKKVIILSLIILLTTIISGCNKKIELIHNVPDEIYIDEVYNLEFNQSVDIEILTPEIIDVVNNQLICLSSGIGEIEVKYSKGSMKFEIIVKPLNNPKYLKLVIDEDNLVTDKEYNFTIDYGVEHPKEANLKISSQSPEININLTTKTISFTSAGIFNLSFFDNDNLSLVGSNNFDVHFSSEYNGYNVLFVGNSLTKYTYNIPKMLEYLLDEAGIRNSIIIDSVNSTWLDEHEESFNKLIKKNYYTHVVLQERSNGPVIDYNRYNNIITKYNELIKVNGADLVIYETWAYNYDSQEQKDALRDSLFAACTKCAEDHNGLLVRSGEAFRLFETKNNSISLYAENDINHPSLYGAFLSSCTFFTTLTKTSVKSLDYLPEGISKEIGDLIKDVADEIGLSH